MCSPRRTSPARARVGRWSQLLPDSREGSPRTAMLPVILVFASLMHPPTISRRGLLAAAVPVVSVSPALAAADRSTFDSVSTQTPQTSASDAQFKELPSGLKYKDVTQGTGASVAAGDEVAVQFTGRLLNLNGKKFMSTKDKAAEQGGLPEPYTFVVGSGAAIPGLEQLVVGMSKGGVRRGVIPPSLGYDSDMKLGPTPDNVQDLQALSSVVKNPNRDASLLMDVKLERLKPARAS